MAASSGGSYLAASYTTAHALLLNLYRAYGTKADFKIETYYEPTTGTDVLEISVLFDGGGGSIPYGRQWGGGSGETAPSLKKQSQH